MKVVEGMGIVLVMRVAKKVPILSSSVCLLTDALDDIGAGFILYEM